jgi:4-diphosphocytidyl-2-C-methyl-D-erythritol kinase
MSVPGVASRTISFPVTSASTKISVRSFAKINLGLYIGARRADGFHDLRTVYQTIALHDVIHVSASPGNGIEIRCDDPRVPLDSSNTCHRIAVLVMQALGAEAKVTIEIEKRLPVQGGLGAASSNAVATMLALEKALAARRLAKHNLSGADRLGIAAKVGSDLPLFVLGGTVLGVGRGEQVYPLPDLPPTPLVVVTPEIGVSTPKAFADWDALAELTHSARSDRLIQVGRVLSAWLGGTPDAGAPAEIKRGGRAGSLLSDLVRAGIGNDFEEVVFSQFPELRDMKRALERAGSRYASLSGSGSTLYGLFRSAGEATGVAKRFERRGLKAVATRTLTLRDYRKKWFVVGR